MTILHTVNSSPFQTHALQQCLALLNSEDSLLLIEDAVIASQAKHAHFDVLKQLALKGKLFVLDSDIQARGIDNEIGEKCNYADFVALSIVHQSQIAW